jgi:hypothetical protein
MCAPKAGGYAGPPLQKNYLYERNLHYGLK